MLLDQLAKEQGFELSAIAGTGPGGRIIAADVKEFVPAAAPAEVSQALRVWVRRSFRPR